MFRSSSSQIGKVFEMKSYISYLCCFCYFIGNAYGAELSDYVKKCSLSDPGLADCIRDNANLAIPELVKGIPAFGVPPLEPARIPEYHLNGGDFEMVLKEVYVYGFKNFNATHVDFYHKNLSDVLYATIPYLNISANYVITNGDPFARSFHGGGRVNISLLGNSLKTTFSFKAPVVDGVKNFRVLTLVLVLNTQNVHYSFNDIDKIIEGDVDRFIGAHSKIIEGELLPGIAKLITEQIRVVVDKVCFNVPFNSLFDP